MCASPTPAAPPRRHWDGPATLHGCQPDCPGHPCGLGLPGSGLTVRRLLGGRSPRKLPRASDLWAPGEGAGGPVPSGRGPTDHGGLQVHEHGPGHVLARPGLAEERVEGVIPAADGLVAGHLAVGLNAMLQAVQLPAGVADLDARLPHVDGDALALEAEQRVRPSHFAGVSGWHADVNSMFVCASRVSEAFSNLVFKEPYVTLLTLWKLISPKVYVFPTISKFSRLNTCKPYNVSNKLHVMALSVLL